MLRLILLISILLLLVLWASDARLLGNTKKTAFLESMKRCEDYPDVPEIYLKPFKYNRTTTTVTGNSTLDFDFDDTLSVDFEMRRWGDGGWKHNSLKVQKKKACSSLRLILGDLFVDVLKNAGREPTCPVPKGVVKLTSFIFDVSKCPVIIMEGKFQNIIKFINPQGKVLFCMDNIINIQDSTV